jgi:hypothetical protein
LFRRQPVAETDAKTPNALHAANACGQLRAQEAGVGRLVRHTTHGRQAKVDRRWRVLPLLEVDPIAENDGTVERETWLRAVPCDELTNRVVVGPLSAP